MERKTLRFPLAAVRHHSACYSAVVANGNFLQCTTTFSRKRVPELPATVLTIFVLRSRRRTELPPASAIHRILSWTTRVEGSTKVAVARPSFISTEPGEPESVRVSHSREDTCGVASGNMAHSITGKTRCLAFHLLVAILSYTLRPPQIQKNDHTQKWPFLKSGPAQTGYERTLRIQEGIRSEPHS